MTLEYHLAFIGCAIIATLTQSMTGFALGLLLIGLVEVFGLAPLADASMVVSILTCVNAVFTVRRSSPKLPSSIVIPLVVASLACVPLGALILTLLSKNEIFLLKFSLGCLIVISSFTLIFSVQVNKSFSGKWTFWATGGVTGLLSGMFSTGGPPLVHLLYRQPASFECIKNTLLLIFASNALVRIIALVLFGDITSNALVLSVECIPIVLLLSYLLARWPLNLPKRVTKLLVFSLLFVSGASLISHSVSAYPF